VTPLGDHEAVIVSLDLVVQEVVVVTGCLLVLLVPGVTDPLVEEQREDVGLVIGGVHRSS
jgi:hypothetical protein